jgi:hypothetical protein
MRKPDPFDDLPKPAAPWARALGWSLVAIGLAIAFVIAIGDFQHWRYMTGMP